MNGKQHVKIGTTLGIAGTYWYLAGNFSPSNIATYAAPIVIGTVIGAYDPDRDHKKAKAAQVFNKIVLTAIVSVALASYIDIPVLNKLLGFAKDSISGNIGMILFIGNFILGRLSPHRQYTHRILGTLVSCVTAYMAFEPYIAIGYIVGYLSHILADRLTADGKYLDFFRFQLPMTNSKGEFYVSI